MKTKVQNRHGAATVVAVVTLMLVDITIAGMMTHIGMQARRTHEEMTRAQRQQIEIAQSMGKGVRLPDELRAR